MTDDQTFDQKVEAVIIAVQELVDDEQNRWAAKRDRILKKLKDDDDRKTAFDEFVSWFEEE